MIGLSLTTTAIALEPRRLRISSASLFRIRLTASWLGAINSLPSPYPRRYRRTLNPRKSKPSSRWTMHALSSLKISPSAPAISGRRRPVQRTGVVQLTETAKFR